MAHVRHLASSELHGRAACTADERSAADYVASKLDEAGVATLPGSSSRLHRIDTTGLPDGCRSVNVLGFLGPHGPTERDAGKRDGRPAIVVVGAHYDHLGVKQGVSYLGAEDNASGVAVALEIAAALKRQQPPRRHAVLFAFFGAEEVGMLGSKAFVRKPTVQLDRIVAMLNIDMIGRRLVDRTGFGLLKAAWQIDDRRAVGIVGTKRFPALRALVDTACKQEGIRAYAPGDFPELIAKEIERQSRGRGDNWPFARAGVPTVFFSSGESDDYHKPTDRVDTLEPNLMLARAKAIYRTVVALANANMTSLRGSAVPSATKLQ